MPRISRRISDLYDVSLSDLDNDQSALSTEVISTMLNQMLGTSLLLLPDAFKTDGILSACVTVVFIGYVNFRTADLGHRYVRPGDADLSATVKRYLSPTHSTVYALNTCLFFFTMSLVIFLFSCDMVSDIAIFFCREYTKNDQLEYQIRQIFTPLVVGLVFFSILRIKDLSVFVNLGAYGLLSLILLIIFILGDAIYTVYTDKVKLEYLKPYSLNVSNIASIMPLAFANHPIIVPLVRKYHETAKISRDLKLSYGFGVVFYILFGILGLLAISGKPREESLQTIVKYYNSSVLCLFINMCFLFSLVSSVPVYIIVSQRNFFEGIKVKRLHSKQKLSFRLLFVVLSMVIKMTGFKVEDAMGIAGCVFAYYITLFVPSMIHLKHKEQERNRIFEESLIEHKEDKDVEIVNKTMWRVKFQYYFILLFGLALIGLQVYKLFPQN